MVVLLDKWRDQYDGIYKVEICGETFIWRELTKTEFDRAKRYYSNTEEREEYVCKLCVLQPSNYDFSNCYAGIPTMLTKLILKESGFIEGVSRSMLDYYRSEMTEFEHQIAPIICAAFPGLSLEEVQEWTVRKTVKYLTRAEWMLSTIHGSPLRFGDNQEEIDYDAFPELKKRGRP